MCTHMEFFMSHFSKYETFFPIATAIQEAEDHYDDPHIKRALRVHAWAELNMSGKRMHRLWNTGRTGNTVTYKLKADELLPVNKLYRMIGDLGVAASLQGFRNTKKLKEAQAANVVRVAGAELQFIPSCDPELMQAALDKLISPPERVYFCYFSDDSCLSIRDDYGNVTRYNLDIAACDASHGEIMFRMYTLQFPERVRDDAEVLVDQCRLPLFVQSYSDKKNYVILEHDDPILISGSTITTSMNNLATMAIGYAIAITGAHDVESIKAAALLVGYVLTVDVCEIVEDIQFLKNSPVLDTHGEYRMFLNIGVFLRSTGTCHGDLPGRGPLQPRMLAYQEALINGMYPRARFPLRDLVSTGVYLAGAVAKVRKMLEYTTISNGTFTFDSDAIYKRYRLDPAEAHELHDLFRAGTNHYLAGSAVDKIMFKDYNIRSPLSLG